jgi:hypothetical protein
MNIVTKTLKSLQLQGGCSFEKLSALVNARSFSKQAQRRRFGLLSGCSRWLMNNSGQATLSP